MIMVDGRSSAWGAYGDPGPSTDFGPSADGHGGVQVGRLVGFQAGSLTRTAPSDTGPAGQSVRPEQTALLKCFAYPGHETSVEGSRIA
jgi:hypothetical protein